MAYNLLRGAIFFGAMTLVLTSCQKISTVFEPQNPREAYVEGIQQSPLANNATVQKWRAAGNSVLNDPVPMNIPSQTKVVYFSDEANAWAWQFSMKKGRTFRAHMARSDTSHQVFMDLFVMEDGEKSLEQSAEDSLITYTLEEDQTLILRLQPELLITGSATITIIDNPSMEFPVSGGIRADIGSFWGDPRDGGRRNHKGVDIFANRGTPVIATADGRVTRTGNAGLGGKTVWLRANGKALYYAHLDSINTYMGAGVDVGDTLGFVGNTGNARTTPPHLHFGIYDRGAVNPLPFIDFANDRVEPITADPSPFPKWARISTPKANVRPLPSTQKEPIASLSRNNPVQVTGGTGEWYQVQLPAGIKGFIFQSLVEPAASSLQDISFKSEDYLFKDFTDFQPMLTVDSEGETTIYAHYENRDLIRYKNKWMWIENK